MIQINLLSGREGAPKKAPKESTAVTAFSAIEGESNAIVVIAAIVFILGLVGFGVWGYTLYNTKEAKARELRAKKQELKRYQGLIELEKRFRAQKELLEKKEQTIVQLKDRQSQPMKLLQEIYNRCPDTVWFESIVQKGSTVTIKGRAKNSEAANQFYQDLSHSPIVQNIDYPLLRKDEKYRIPNVVYFEMVLSINQSTNQSSKPGMGA
ncbi:MAG: hypothetical protein GXO69_03205 [Acidobacteria bacterium]|nr:hypothetical protein [Acidobacteriota bacterium]